MTSFLQIQQQVTIKFLVSDFLKYFLSLLTLLTQIYAKQCWAVFQMGKELGGGKNPENVFFQLSVSSFFRRKKLIVMLGSQLF
jgi:hypothetical protein